MPEPKDPRRIVDTLRQLLAEQPPDSVTMQFQLSQNGGSILRPQGDPVPTPPAKAMQGPAGKISHSPDFSAVHWHDGNTYPFTPHQRPVVAMLWKAMEEGVHFVGSGALLEAAEVNSTRMRELFRASKAWGKVIVQGIMHGGSVDTYRLAPLGDEAERNGAA